MLINAVTQLAYEFEVTENGTNDPAQESVNGRSLTAAEKISVHSLSQISVRTALRRRWRKPPILGSIVSSHCDSWRSIIICRPIREYSSDESGNFKPEVLSDAANVEIDGLDKELVLELLENQENERLYKYIIITQCNALNKGLPEMFEQIGGWTELLFPKKSAA